MLKKRRMLLSLGAASLVTGPLALTAGIRYGPRAGPSADVLLVGRRALAISRRPRCSSRSPS